MKVQDLDATSTVNNTDEIIITNSTTHKSFRITFVNFFTAIWNSITNFANLTITTLFKVTGDTELKDTDITGDVDITGNTQITGNLEVTGSITQQGSAYETHAEKVYTKDDVINLRDGAVAGLATGEYAGVIAKHYDQDGNDGALVFDKNGEARVGDYSELSDDTEPLLTRDETANMTDKAMLVWDAIHKRAVKGPVPASANKVLISQSDGSFVWGDYSVGADLTEASSVTITGRNLIVGVIIRIMFINDIIGSDTSTGLVINYNNTNYSVKVAKNGSLADFVATAMGGSPAIYKYLQAYTTLELFYDGTQFIIVGNPVVISNANYTIYADGKKVLIAGSAAGNVPLVGTALGTTDNNVLVTDPSGALKPYGTTAPKMMTYGVYSSATASMSGSETSLKATIAVTNLTGLTAAAGTVLKVTFSKALEHTAAIYSVELTFGGVTKAIKAARGGSLVNLVSHQFSGGNYNSSKPHKVWDAYTTLELMYTGNEWVVMGDTVLCSYFSTTQSYTIKTNGLIRQWGTVTKTPVRTFYADISFYIAFNSYSLNVSPTSEGLVAYFWVKSMDSSGKINVCFTGNQSQDLTSAVKWMAEGY